MKISRSPDRAPQLTKAIEVVKPETPDTDTFRPDRDIPPDVRKALFTELDEFSNRKMWLEYVLLYNNLEMLFPDMDGRKKVEIPEKELLNYWKNKIEPTRWPGQIGLEAFTNRAGKRHTSLAAVALGIRTFGLPIDTLFTPELQREFLTNFEKGEDGGSTDFIQDALFAVQLGLFKQDKAFKHPEAAWEKLQSFMRPQKVFSVSLRIESIALAKIFFPEHPVEISADLIALLRKAAVQEGKVFGPLQSSEVYKWLFLATAETVHIGENGELLVQRPAKIPGGGAIQLPERQRL